MLTKRRKNYQKVAKANWNLKIAKGYQKVAKLAES